MGYWQDRKAAQMDAAQMGADEVIARLEGVYKNSYAQTVGYAKQIKRRMARRYGLSEADVERYLSEPCGREEYLELLREIDKLPIGSEARRTLEAKASSGAYAYRVSRLEAQKDTIDAMIGQMAAEKERIISSYLMDTAAEQTAQSMFALQRQAGVAWSFSGASEGMLRQIVYSDWSGANFSRRIWRDRTALSGALTEIIGSGLMTGQSIKHMSEMLAYKMGVSYGHAKTLIRTETTHAVVQSDMMAMESAQIDRYEFVAVLDKKTSDICQTLDGQIFRRAEAQTGKNLPPMHPNCRSIDAAYFDDEDYKRLTRISRDPVTGETVKVPRTIKYRDWIKLQRDRYGNEAIDKAVSDAKRAQQKEAAARRMRERRERANNG